MNKKLKEFVKSSKLAIILSVVSIFFELMYSFLGSILNSGLWSIGIALMNIQKLVYLPIFIIGAISNETVLFFTYYYSPSYIYPSLIGNILTVIFWFAIGILIEKVYNKYKKR